MAQESPRYDHILQAINESFPFTIATVNNVFDFTKSYDQTIFILQRCAAGGLDPNNIISDLKQIKYS